MVRAARRFSVASVHQVAEQEGQHPVVNDVLGGNHLAIFVIDVVFDPFDRAFEAMSSSAAPA